MRQVQKCLSVQRSGLQIRGVYSRVQQEIFFSFFFCRTWSFQARFPPQVENGKLSEHEHSSTMEHMRLLLPMVLSLTRARTEIPDSGEWQEDSGLGLYRAPEEGVNMGAGAAASVHSVDLEKKVRPRIAHFFFFFVLIF